MSNDFDERVRLLEEGSAHGFRDWPATHLEVGPSGVYTVWNGDLFLYAGCGWKHRDEANPTSPGVFGRLESHASGRRSGNQFAIYVCDRFVVPCLSDEQRDALARGERILDAATKRYIHDHLTYRVAVTDSTAMARDLERLVRHDGLPRSGRPQINPL